MAAAIKDSGEIWARLFDHRPFVSGEIKYFLTEFEEKRSDREIERLFGILERVTDIKDTQIERVQLASDVHIPTFNANLEVALSMCDKIIEKESHYNCDKSLIAKRDLRKTEWENFIEEMARKCSRVDKTFVEKEEELKEFYVDLERKLHLSN